MAQVDVPAPGGQFAGATTDRGRTPGGRFNGDGISGFVAQVLEASILWIGVNPPESSQYVLWINTEDGRWYGKWNDGDSIQWVDLSLPFGEGLPGPRGPRGERGLTGFTGQGIPTGGAAEQILVKLDGTDYNTYWGDRPADGYSVLNGSTDPDDALDGVDGDFYINTTSWEIFGPKTSGLWGVGTSLIGPTGPTGATGPAGADGADGANGVGVPAGGTAGQVLSKIDSTDYNTEWVTPAAGGGGISLVSSSTDHVVTNGNLSGEVYLDMDSVSAMTVTVNSGLTGTEPLTVERKNTGTVTFVAGVGVTINSRGGLLSIGNQYGTVTLVPKGSDTYTLIGDLA